MEKQNASLDASFWINAYNGEIVHLVPDYFRLFACGVVAEEIRYPLDVLGLSAAGPLLFNEWCRAGIITLQDPQTPVDWFQRGENAAIALAIEQGYFLLIDDANPYHMARSKGLKVVGTMDFAVLLYDHGRLSYDAALAAIQGARASKKQKRDAIVALETLIRRKEGRDVG